MANIKRVFIGGWMPFDGGGSEKLLRYLGTFNLPSVGIRISYAGPARMIPNEHKGVTTLYQFQLEGEEAMRTEAFIEFADLIRKAKGIIDEASVFDIEANQLVWAEVNPDHIEV